ncbi:MAG: glycosyltransferase family 4 protein [Lentisphaerae bacterium]|nr:glycosyltransferase family 4 protein [Lentisphaerota bacterium]
MKIVKIIPGAGGTFYCENCMRDSALVKALRGRGHDVVMVPMYLPLYTDDLTPIGEAPVFFGGINVYLQQNMALFRHTPRWLDRLFDSAPMLALAARGAGSTRAAGLGEMTLSMLAGRDGKQAKELARLIAWLQAEGRPDVVHVASVLLLGLARPLKEALGAAIVYGATNESVWVDAIAEPYRTRCWETMARKAADADRFITVSRYYADGMRERLRIAPDRFDVVPMGIETKAYACAEADPSPPCIGFLSRMSEGLGLGVLADAFAALKRENPDLAASRLRVMGGHTGDDRAFLARLRRRLDAQGMGADAEFLPDLDRAGRVRFLKSLSVLSVPIPGGEAFGTFVLEALACGVPVVQPRAGAFPEIVEATGGGLLYDPADPAGLKNALAALLRDRARARRLALRGREIVLERYDIDRMADATLEVYGKAAE